MIEPKDGPLAGQDRSAPQVRGAGAKFSDLYDLDDRSAAITAVARVDNLLLQLLKLAMSTPDSLSSKLLEGPTAPLGSFSARILAAAGFGLITDWTRVQLDAVRKVRNVFAHDESHGLTFEHPTISGICLRMVTAVDLAYQQVGEESPDREPRSKFHVLVVELCGQLEVLAERVAPMHPVPMTMFEQARMDAAAREAMRRRVELANEGKGDIRSWYLEWGTPVRPRTDRPGAGDPVVRLIGPASMERGHK